MSLLTNLLTYIIIFDMNKIPMQIYFDPDTAAFYKAYAQSLGKSFAEVIREIATEKKQEIISKKKFRKNIRKKGVISCSNYIF